MNTQSSIIIGTQLEGGVYVGRINVNGAHKGILLPSKSERQYPSNVIWNEDAIDGALSYCDGLANTRDMAAAGSKLAQWALTRGMHIPSLDELEIIYRTCKPDARKNSRWYRSGINLNAAPPTHPYTQELPAQTTLEKFREGGPEAFDTNDWYWSSTRHADNEYCAWFQWFGNGLQHYDTVSDAGLGCAVRWIDL